MKQTARNKRKVVITGMGVISSLGYTLFDNHTSLRKGQTGIGQVHHFQSNYADMLPFAEIKCADQELAKRNEIDDDPSLTRTTLIAMQAFDEAINHAQLTTEELQSSRTAFLSSSTVGGMCYTDALYADANDTGNVSPFVASYEGSDHTVRIALKYGLNGYTDTINTACSSSANAILIGMKLIQSGRVDRAIVGGADCLAKYTVNGFNSLRILSEEPCKPFDVHRNGLTLGEAAAYLVLEAEELVGDKVKWAVVSGGGNANDAFHPSATSENARGPVLAMERALQQAGLSAKDIDYINAHGTGTENNDRTESIAFQHVFGSPPPFNSTKSYTGHTLAAAGAIESVFTVLSLFYQELYPSLNCADPQPEFPFQPIVNLATNHTIQHAMTNSFGFGGNCTSLVLSRCS